MKYFLFCFIAFISLALPAYADTDFGDFGLRESANKGLLPGSEMVRTSPPTIQSAIGSIMGSVLTFVGVIFLLLMIYAGFLWMTGSRSGKDDDINKAKKIISWAIAGLAVIFLSYTIVSFVIEIAKTAPKPPVAPPAETK